MTDLRGCRSILGARGSAKLQSYELMEIDDFLGAIGGSASLSGFPEWALAEVAAWPQDAWGVYQARLLLRDGSVSEWGT